MTNIPSFTTSSTVESTELEVINDRDWLDYADLIIKALVAVAVLAIAFGN